MEIKRREADISHLRASEEEEGKQQEIKALAKVVATLKLSSKKNLLKREITNLQLVESM
jgi:hypothetical protein